MASIKKTQYRLDFLNALKRELTNVEAQAVLQGTRLAQVVLGDTYKLANKNDAAKLISELSNTIDNELKPQTLLTVSNSIRTLTSLAITESVLSAPKAVEDATKYMSLAEQIATSYINRVTQNGGSLLTNIWSDKDKQAIYNEVYDAIKKGSSNYELAQKIAAQVSSGTPMSNIKRVADTEMTFAYGNAKMEIAQREEQEYGLKAYVTYRLSPAHAIYDICDELVGTYELSKAPGYPFHPRCHCIEDIITK